MPSIKSVVISCAGIGSRLGLATTKALVEIEGKSVIARQIEALNMVEDIRIVVGYQAGDVINEVRRYRPDAIFVYNHDYFTTKTGASFYLGARHGFDYFEWTGPACIMKSKLKYSSGHVFNMLEPYLPMRGIKIRACDIDTYDDYTRAIEFVRSWEK